MEGRGEPHIGIFQDSFLCELYTDDIRIDLRYFSYKGQTIEFYMTEISELKLYMKNIGDTKLRTSNFKTWKLF